MQFNKANSINITRKYRSFTCIQKKKSLSTCWYQSTAYAHKKSSLSSSVIKSWCSQSVFRDQQQHKPSRGTLKYCRGALRALCLSKSYYLLVRYLQGETGKEENLQNWHLSSFTFMSGKGWPLPDSQGVPKVRLRLISSFLLCETKIRKWSTPSPDGREDCRSELS